MQNEKTTSQLGPGVSWSNDPRSEAMLEHHSKEEYELQRPSEEQILFEAKRLLHEHPGIDARNISVKVENHCIVLEGFVETKQEKKIVKFLMENLSGVRGVFNFLHLKL